MSNEDVIPNWLRNHMILNMDDPEAWAQLLPRVKIRVCKACNGRMNAAFEQPARDLVLAMWDGKTLQLSPTDARAVAAWILKVEALYALMRHWRDDVSPAVHPLSEPTWVATESEDRHRQDLLQLLNGGEPPPATTICAIYMSADERLRPLGIRTDGFHDGYSATNVMPLLFETVIRDHLAVPHRAVRSSDPRWVQLWPAESHESVPWPPQHTTSILDVLDYQAALSKQSHFMPMGRRGPEANEWRRLAIDHDPQGTEAGLFDLGNGTL
jgi:hypothetical protein